MLEILLFDNSERAVEYFKKYPNRIEEAFSDIEMIRRLIIDSSETMEIIIALDIVGLTYKNSVDAMSQLARIDVRLLQVKYYLEACEYAAENIGIDEPEKLTWKI